MEINKDIFARRLHIMRVTKGITLDELGRQVGLAPSTVQRYEAGKINRPKLAVVTAMANALGSSLEELCGAEEPENLHEKLSDRRSERPVDKLPDNMLPADDDPSELIRIPVIGRVAAGYACHAEEYTEDYEYVNRMYINSQYDYVYLRVRGDSMYPLFQENDLVLVQCRESVENGDYAVFVIDDEDGIVKRFYRYPNRIELISENPYYPPRIFHGSQMERVRIFGRVVEVRRKFL